MSRFETPVEAGQAFATWIARTRYSEGTAAMYVTKVQAFLDWLDDNSHEHAGALEDEHLRDYAVRDFRRDLMTVRKLAPSTVETYLSSIAAFYEYLGLGKPAVKRAARQEVASKALDEDVLRKVLRLAERRGPRDFALAMLIFGTGLRVSEAVGLDTDDVFITERMGQVEVRHGKGGAARTVYPPAATRTALRAWIAARRAFGAPELGPLFLSREGGRLSQRRAQSLLSALGSEVGVRLTPHVLRHTYARFFLQGGGDLGELQQNLGHKHLSSTQVYTGATRGQRAESAERVRIDL